MVWLFTPGTDEAQILKKCQALGYPESDDDKSDYFADDEISPSSSPCHNNVFDSENEARIQNSKGMCNIIMFGWFALFGEQCLMLSFLALSHLVKFGAQINLSNLIINDLLALCMLKPFK